MFQQFWTRALTSISTIVMMGAMSSASAYYDPITGMTWHDLSDIEIRNFTWYEIAAVCPQDGVTPCDGSATPGITKDDVFTGWIWGTNDQVNDLFKDVTGLGSLLDNYVYRDVRNPPFTWGATAIAALGETLFVSNNQVIIHASRGWTSTPILNDAARFHGMISTCDGTGGDQASCPTPDQSIDAFQEAVIRLPPLSDQGALLNRSVFLYQVPEPTTLALLGLGLGLAGLCFSRRKH